MRALNRVFRAKTINTQRRGVAFSIRQLFANSEPGVWYDPSDLSTLFQDAAGTTPVTAVEQPVGLMLDKSKGLVLGSELVSNGDFSSSSVWTLNNAAITMTEGKLVFSSCAAGFSASQTINSVAGRWYEVRLEISDFVTGRLDVRFGSGNNQVASANGSYVVKILADGTNFQLRTGSTSTFKVDNVSVRELPGNHASQPTATSRPVLSARVNLLTKTEQFDDAVWTKLNVTVTANAAVAPDGTVTADRVTTSATDGLVYLPTYANSYPQPITFSVCAKADASSSLTIQFTSSGNGRGAAFDLNAGTCTAVVAIGTGTGVSGGVSSIAALGGNWYRCTISNISVTDLLFPVFNVVGPSNSSIYVWGASLVPANQSSLPYQRVNTSTDYDSDASKFPAYLKFDGVDDWLVTNTITPGTDKVQVFAGVRKLKLESQAQAIVELGSNSFETNGISVFSGGAVSNQTNEYSTIGFANTVYGRDYAVSAIPSTDVLTALFDVANPVPTSSQMLRANGASAAGTQVVGTNMGTGNYLASPLYIGRRGGTKLPFNGHLYSLIVRFGANLPAATIENTEKYINGLTKAY